MKKIFSITFLVLSSLIYSQNSADNLYDFKLKDKELTWSHVYESDLNANDLKSNLIKSISSLNNLTNISYSENSITYNVKNDTINYKSLGGTWSTTPDFVKCAQNYSVSIQIREYKYVISISNINISYRSSATMRVADFSSGWQNIDLIDIVGSKSRTRIKPAKSINKGMNYIHQHYLMKFDNLPNSYNELN